MNTDIGESFHFFESRWTYYDFTMFFTIMQFFIAPRVNMICSCHSLVLEALLERMKKKSPAAAATMITTRVTSE